MYCSEGASTNKVVKVTKGTQGNWDTTARAALLQKDGGKKEHQNGNWNLERKYWHLRWEMQRETAEWTLGRKDANFYWIIHYFYFIYLLFTLVLSNSKAAASAIGCLLVWDRFYLVRISLVNWWRFNLYFIDECWRWLLGNSQTSKQARQNKTNKQYNIENEETKK